MSDQDRQPDGFDANELLSLLSEQRDAYHELGRLAERQRALITADEPEQLLAVLAQRQKVLDRLTAMADRVRPYQEQWQALRPGMGAEVGDQVDRLIAEIRQTLSVILEKDEADARLLAARKGSTARSMGALKQGRQADAAYAASGRESAKGSDWANM